MYIFLPIIVTIIGCLLLLTYAFLQFKEQKGARIFSYTGYAVFTIGIVLFILVITPSSFAWTYMDVDSGANTASELTKATTMFEQQSEIIKARQLFPNLETFPSQTNDGNVYLLQSSPTLYYVNTRSVDGGVQTSLYCIQEKEPNKIPTILFEAHSTERIIDALENNKCS